MIIKTPIDASTSHIRMPAGAKHLSVQLQDMQVQLWSDVEFADDLTDYEVRSIPTGIDSPKGFEYVSTVQVGDFVFHFYIKEAT